MNRGEILKAILPLLMEDQPGKTEQDPKPAEAKDGGSSLSKDDIVKIVQETVTASLPAGAKAPENSAQGITPESLKSMTAEQINENWGEVSKTLSSMTTN